MNGPSDVFNLWSERRHFAHERILVSCPSHAVFHQKANRLIRKLIEIGSDRVEPVIRELVGVRRAMECSPGEFDATLLERIQKIGGGRATMQMHYSAGDELGHLVEATAALCQAGNAIRANLDSTVLAKNQTYIFCHRQETDKFREVLGPDIRFLNSLTAYRSCDILDCLLVLGGFRRVGMGRVPESILTAPRFRRLTQVMWTTDADDPAFGSVASFLGFEARNIWTLEEVTIDCRHAACASRRVDNHNHADSEIIDAWIAKKRNAAARNVTNPTRIALGGGKCMVLRGGGHALVFCAADQEVRKECADQVEEGDILLTYDGEIDFGESADLQHPLVLKWRNDVRHAKDENTERFYAALRGNGVRLKGLPSCVERWIGSHRPQQKETLQKVCKTLGWGDAQTTQLWTLFMEHHGQAVRDGNVESDLELEVVEGWIKSNGIVHALRDMPGSVGHREFTIQIGEDSLRLHANVVEGTDRIESADESEIGKILHSTDLLA